MSLKSLHPHHPLVLEQHLSGCPSGYQTSTVTTPKESQSTDLHHRLGLILSSPTTGLLTEWPLVALCWLSDINKKGKSGITQ